MTTLDPSRAARRAALVAQIALERDAIASVWNRTSQRMAQAKNAWRLAGSVVRRPVLIVAVAGAVWVIGFQRSFSLLRGIASVRPP